MQLRRDTSSLSIVSRFAIFALKMQCGRACFRCRTVGAAVASRRQRFCKSEVDLRASESSIVICQVLTSALAKSYKNSQPCGYVDLFYTMICDRQVMRQVGSLSRPRRRRFESCSCCLSPSKDPAVIGSRPIPDTEQARCWWSSAHTATPAFGCRLLSLVTLTRSRLTPDRRVVWPDR